MAERANTLPDLDRRLQEKRGEVADTLGELRQRVRDDLRELSPRRQLRRHPEAALIGAAAAGLLAGRLVGGLLAALWR